MGFDEMDVDTIWMDGDFVDWDDAQVHVLTHSLHYGTGVFEGARCYDTVDGPAIFRWEEHLDRLFDSAKVMELDIGHSREELTDATMELIRTQDLESCYIRPLVFYGYDSLGVSPTECPTRTMIACWPWGAYLGEEAIEEGVDVMVSSWRKHSSSQIPTNMKATGPYVNSMLAGEEARRNGYVEAILLNSEGKVAEGPGENIFMINDGELYTTGLSESNLDGITRNTVIELAQNLGYPVNAEASIARGQLYTADELFFTGTAAEVTPIRTVDDVQIGNGTRGPITEEIQSKFFDLVDGRLDGYDEWLLEV
ncbi:MAG: branched-chain amino acid transaminase [Natronomonas sp.]